MYLDLIDNLDNFNVSPDVVDSGQAIAEAEEAIEEIEKWDPEPKHTKAENVKDEAKKIKYDGQYLLVFDQ